MKIAVPFENGKIFQHFGKTAGFQLYETAAGEIRSSSFAPVSGGGHGAFAAFLAEQNVDTVLCGGIGPGAQAALAEAGIRLIAGIQGAADEAVASFLCGKLQYDPGFSSCGHGAHRCSGGCGH